MREVQPYTREQITLAGAVVAEVGLWEDDDAIRHLVAAREPTPGEVEQARQAGVSGTWRRVADGWEWQGDRRVTCPVPVAYRDIPQPRSIGFVHLHAHSDFSALDGMSTVAEMVQAAVDDEQPALALTDHGVASGHPELVLACAKAGIKPVLGIEAYLVDDRLYRPPPKPAAATLRALSETQQEAALAEWREAGAIGRDYYHLILWAQTQEGLRNLWAISSQGYLDGFYHHPRIDWSVLERFSDGVMASTGCLRGPLAHPIVKYRDDTLAKSNLGRLLDLYGDRLYVELHTNALDEQREANKIAVEMAHDHGLPTIAVVDSHYPCKADQQVHKVWLAAQTKSELSEDSDLFSGDCDYHMMTCDEVRASLSYLPESVVEESIANTVTVADRCNATLVAKFNPPVFSRTGGHERDRDRLVEMCLANWSKVQGKEHGEDEYLARFDEEAAIIIEADLCGYFLMVADQVRYAKDNGVLVGPGRGSGAGSLIAYLAGITEIDPLQYGLLFERFLTRGRKSMPDFDVDYPASCKEMMHDYCSERWGEDHVVRVGTHLRMQTKATFRDLGRIFREQIDYADINAICAIVDEAEAGTAGLGLAWDDLMAQHGSDLAPYREKYRGIFALAERMTGRLKSYGRHAAGLVISPDEELAKSLPVRTVPGVDQPISQFDFEALESLGYLKFDQLTLRTLDTLQWCLDLIRERRGDAPDLYAWRDEYADPQVWDEICEGRTLGMFQIETVAMNRLVRRQKPRSIEELADSITLVRPGPDRSGLTAAYLRRRAGEERVTLVDERLREVLEPTYGTIIYQESVMKACQVLAGYSLQEADGIRKILGKKKVDQVEAAGREFVPRAVEHGMEREAAKALWEQLEFFASYSFNKAHAVSYAVMAYWTAWCKVHYPAEFLTAVLSTADKKRFPAFVEEVRRMGWRVAPPDINASGRGFAIDGTVIRYGFDAVGGIGDAACEAIMEGQPYESFEDYLERKGSKANAGVTELLVKLGAFDSLGYDRKALVARVAYERSPRFGVCKYRDDSQAPLPCMFDWANEPVELSKRGVPKKRKAPPKKCTKACRQYDPADPPNLYLLDPYTDVEVREIEREVLGVYLSSTPFDRIPEDVSKTLDTASDIEAGSEGAYNIAAIVSKVRPHTDRAGRKMGFLQLTCEDGEVDATVFASLWSTIDRPKVDDLCLVSVVKKADRCHLAQYVRV